MFEKVYYFHDFVSNTYTEFNGHYLYSDSKDSVELLISLLPSLGIKLQYKGKGRMYGHSVEYFLVLQCSDMQVLESLGTPNLDFWQPI